MDLEKEAQEKREALNRLMAEQRARLAEVLHELQDGEAQLREARRRHGELAHTVATVEQDIGTLGQKNETRRKQLFAMKMELEGMHQVVANLANPAPEAEGHPGPQQRAHPRAPYHLHVNFGGLSSFYAGFAINISDGGLLVATCDPPPIGKRFAVEIELSADQAPIRAPVEVVWTEPVTGVDLAGHSVSHVGLRFAALAPGDQAAITEFTREWLAFERRRARGL